MTQASSSHAPSNVAAPITTVAQIQHNARSVGRSSAPQAISNISPYHSRRDLFSVDYGLCSFDDRDYVIVCTVENMVHTDISLWTFLLKEGRSASPGFYSGRCCSCGSNEHSLRWCPTPVQNIFSLLNPGFTTTDPKR